MKIGIECGSNIEKENFKSLRLIKAAGFDAIDFQGFVDTENSFFKDVELNADEKLKRLARAVKENGLFISQTHGPWRWPPMDTTKELREERFEKMAESIRFTALLGCPYIVLHPIMPNGVSPDSDHFSTWELNVDFFGRLSDVAAREGAVICLENMPMSDFSLASPEMTLKLAKALNSDAVRCCLDTGHATMFGDIGDGARTMGDYLKVLHIHDNDGIHDQHLLPYQGVADWKSFSEAIREIKFDGVLSAETNISGSFPDNAAIKKNEFIAEILKSMQ